MKTLFRKGPALGFRLTALLLASLLLMTLDHRYERLEPVRSVLSVVVYPLRYLVHLPATVSAWSSESLVTRRSLTEENRRLRRQNLWLKTRSQRYAALEAENLRLRELLESSAELGDRVLAADVVAMELGSPTREMLLNKGSRHGVYRGQPIIDGNGVVGQVVHVNPISSTALLITDSSHALPVQVVRSGVRAVATGTGAGDTLDLAYVAPNADVKPGDLIVTSGMDGRFPAGYPVGAVGEIALDPNEPFARIRAEPSAKLGQIREVLLVWTTEPEDGRGTKPAEHVVQR
jgi:rod shape-determining protein MreC